MPTRAPSDYSPRARLTDDIRDGAQCPAEVLPRVGGFSALAGWNRAGFRARLGLLAGTFGTASARYGLGTYQTAGTL